MSGQLLGIQQIDTMRTAAESMAEATNKAVNIVKTLKSLFDGPQLKEHFVAIDIGDDGPLLGTVRTASGLARIKMSSAIMDGQYVPVMVVERKLLDSHDAIEWQEILRLHFPRFETPFVGTLESKTPIETGAFGDRGVQAFYLLGMNISYRIVAGPQS